MPLSQAKDKDGTLYNQITSDDFTTPLITTATVENSVTGNTAAPKMILSRKLEVIPSNTDKTGADTLESGIDVPPGNKFFKNFPPRTFLFNLELLI